MDRLRVSFSLCEPDPRRERIDAWLDFLSSPPVVLVGVLAIVVGAWLGWRS